MKRSASAIIRNPDRDVAEAQARAKVAEAFNGDQHDITHVDSVWYARSFEWAVKVDASTPNEEKS